jgi:hypothetical protein
MLQQAFKNQEFSRLPYFEIQLPSLQSKKNEEVSAYRVSAGKHLPFNLL